MQTFGNFFDAEAFRYREFNQTLFAGQKFRENFIVFHVGSERVRTGTELVVVAAQSCENSKLPLALDNAFFRELVGNFGGRVAFANFNVNRVLNVGFGVDNFSRHDGLLNLHDGRIGDKLRDTDGDNAQENGNRDVANVMPRNFFQQSAEPHVELVERRICLTCAARRNFNFLRVFVVVDG